MIIENERILMFEKSMNLGGSSQIVIQMCEALRCRAQKVIVCSMGGINTKKLEEIAVKHYDIRDISDKKNFFWHYKKIKEIIRNEKITVIHTHHRMAAMYAQILRIHFKCKVFCSIHGEFYDKKWFTKIAYRNCKLIACGNAVKNNLINEFGIDGKNIFVLQNAIERDQKYEVIDEIEQLRSQSNETFFAGYLGRLSAEKGVDVFIKSLKEVLKKNKQIYYVIVGEGYQREELTQLAYDLGVDSHIIFLGYRKDPQNVIQQLDVVVLSSYTEGLPLTPIEAFAHGKPVVATSVGGTSEIVVNGYNGILVEAGNIQMIENAIIKISKNRKLYNKLATNAINTYDCKFSYSIFEGSFIKIYEMLYD